MEVGRPSRDDDLLGLRGDLWLEAEDTRGHLLIPEADVHLDIVDQPTRYI